MKLASCTHIKKLPRGIKNSHLTDAFAVNLDDFIATSKIDFWIYGHHHRNTPTFNIEGTQLITNQLGYVNHDEHKDFSLNETITI